MTPEHAARIRGACDALGDALIAAMSESSTAPMPDRLLSVEEAAEAIGVTRSTLYEHVLPQLKTVRVGRRVLIPSRAVDDYIAAQSVGGTA